MSSTGDELFDLKAATPSIAPVAEILLPPEEIRKRKRRRIVVVIAVVVLLIAAAIVTRQILHARSVESNALAAGDTGRVVDYESAINTLDDGESPGLRARLEVALSIARGEGVDAARSLAEATEVGAERQKALALLAMADGNAALASETASAIQPSGTFGPETLYIQALASFFRGDRATASSLSELAFRSRDSPRIRALHARISGDSSILEGDSTVIVAARPLVSAVSYGPAAETADLATACLAKDDLTVAESRWCDVAVGASKAWRGDRIGARAHLGTWDIPTGDEEYRWFIAESLLVAGATVEAESLINRLELNELMSNEVLRLRTRARLALAKGDPGEALRLLEHVPASDGGRLLAASALIAQERYAAAESALADEGEETLFRADLFALRSELALAQGDADAAKAAALESLEAESANGRTIRPIVRALVAAEDAAGAQAAAQEVVSVFPNDPWAQEALGQAAFAAEDFATAQAAFSRAAVLDETSVRYRVMEAKSAHAAGDFAAAQSAYEAALALDSDNAPALRGAFVLAVETGRTDAALSFRERIDEADIAETKETLLAQVRLYVVVGRGYSALSSVERIVRRRLVSREPYPAFAMGQLLIQAELYPRAAGMFIQARRRGYDADETRFMEGLAWALEGQTNRANDILRELGESLESGDPRVALLYARIQANLGRFDDATRRAEAALAEDDELSHANWIIAEGQRRDRQDPSEQLRAAIGGNQPVSRAAWDLARRVGGDEGCGLARRFLTAAPRSEVADDARDFIERCDSE